jgi:hypothetical protein
MEDPLDSARYLLARAKHHAADFKIQAEAFFNSDPYKTVVELNPKTQENLLKYKLVKPLPTMLKGIVMDAAGNLRSALDQAGFAYAGIEDVDRKTHTAFPFCDHPNELPGRRRGSCKEVPPEIFAVMAAFKPYKGGDDLLWALNKLCNSNKHKIIRPVGIANVGAMLNIERLAVMRGEVRISGKWDSAKNELVVFRVGPNAHANFTGKVRVATQIVFGKVPIIEGQEVGAVLDALSGKVESILNAVEMEAKRAGLG